MDDENQNGSDQASKKGDKDETAVSGWGCSLAFTGLHPQTFPLRVTTPVHSLGLVEMWGPSQQPGCATPQACPGTPGCDSVSVSLLTSAGTLGAEEMVVSSETG